MESNQFAFDSCQFLLTCVCALFGCVCLLLNWALGFVTVRAKWLHSPCNILLALYSGALSTYGIPSIVWLCLTLLYGGNPQMSNIACFCAFSPLLVMFAVAHVLLLAIAVDRFVSVKYAIRYTLLNKRRYLCAIVFVAVLYAAPFAGIAFQNAISAPSGTTSHCPITATLMGASLYFSMTDFALELPAVGVYVALGVLLRNKQQTPGQGGINEQIARRAYKVLLAILLVEVAGLTLNSFFNWLLPKLPIANAPLQSALFQMNTLIALVSCCSGSVILYGSADYRRAFNSYIPLCARISGTNNMVTNAPVAPVQVQVVAPNATWNNHKSGV